MPKHLVWNINKTLESEIQGIPDIKRIQLASAYFSLHGVDFIEKIIDSNNISKSDCDIVIGRDFSIKNTEHILTRLENKSKLKIVDSKILHAKVLLLHLKDDSNLLFLGSSNYTYGGLISNIELNIKIIPTKDQLEEFRLFFSVLLANSYSVDNKIIDAYKKLQPELDKISELDSKRKDIFRSISSINDPFKELDYEFLSKYFQFKDYESVFPKNEKKTEYPHRKVVREKLLELNKGIEADVNKLKLFKHWNTKHVTTGIIPSNFNKNKVSWIGIRYGKSKTEVNNINSGGDKSDQYGFTKHGFIQYGINKEGFFIEIHHAVPNDSWDRRYLQSKIKELEFGKKLISELQKLEGLGYYWYLGEDATFPLEKNTAKNFIDFYTRNRDYVGDATFHISLKPDDERISEKIIGETLLNEIKKLEPLYNLIVQRW